jgi:hypothetical protein
VRMLIVVVLPAPFGPRNPEQLARSDRERHPLDSHQVDILAIMTRDARRTVNARRGWHRPPGGRDPIAPERRTVNRKRNSKRWITSPSARSLSPSQTIEPAPYQPGVCNIGPAEINRRRRAGHTGTIVSAVTFAGLVAVGAPPAARFVVALPATLAASGYLQARLRFCAGFGAAGVFNFGSLGGTEQVGSPEDRARDRIRATQIGMASVAVGIAAGVVAAVLPV